MLNHLCDCQWLYLYLVRKWSCPSIVYVENIVVWLPAGSFLTFSVCQEDVSLYQWYTLLFLK